MTTKTRYFVISSVLVLTVGLATGLVAYYGDAGTSAFAKQGGPDELRLVPADASLVAFAEVADIMATPVGQKFRALLLPGKTDDPKSLQSQTGINIETDVDRIIVGVVSGKEGSQTPGQALLLARGRFDAVKIEALMREHGAQVETYKDQRIITATSTSPDSHQQSFSAAFLEPGLVASGTTALVRSAIDLKTGGANVTTNDNVMQRLRQMEAGQAWAVGRFDVLASQAHLPDGVSQSLPAVTWVSANAAIADGIRGMVRAEARDEASANGVRDVIRGIVAFAKMQSAARPEFQVFFQSLQLGGDGNTVTLSFDAPPAVFDLLGSFAAQHRSARVAQ